jgi:hypothetical protein
MADHCDALRIDVLALQQPAHDGANVFRVVLNSGGFGSSTALAESALVIAHCQKAGIGHCARKLRERGHTHHDSVAITTLDPAKRMTAGIRAAGEEGLVIVAPRLKPMAGIITASSPGFENTCCARGRRRDVFAHDLDSLRRDGQRISRPPSPAVRLIAMSPPGLLTSRS